MINIGVHISNPWADPWAACIQASKFGNIGTYWAWAISLHKNPPTIIDVYLNVQPTGNHAGVTAWIGLLGYFVEFECYNRLHQPSRIS